MEITAYLCLSAFVFILFYVVQTKYHGDNELVIDGFQLKFICGVLLICLGILSLSLEYKLSNGSPSSYTSVTETNNGWNKGLFILFSMLGYWQIVLSYLEGLTYAFYYVKFQKEEKTLGDD